MVVRTELAAFRGVGEVRVGMNGLAAIEPMHGSEVVYYAALFDKADQPIRGDQRIVLDDTLNQGHALACADLLGLGRDQVIAGWRQRNAYASNRSATSRATFRTSA